MQIVLIFSSKIVPISIMRTTLSIPDEVMKKAQKLSGSNRYSEAVVTALKDYIALKERLSYLDYLFDNKVPHSYTDIKQKRRKRKWSS